MIVQYICQTRTVPLIFLQEKLKRLIKYLNFKDIKNKTQKQTSQEDDEVLEASGKYYVKWLNIERFVSALVVLLFICSFYKCLEGGVEV